MFISYFYAIVNAKFKKKNLKKNGTTLFVPGKLSAEHLDKLRLSP